VDGGAEEVAEGIVVFEGELFVLCFEGGLWGEISEVPCCEGEDGGEDERMLDGELWEYGCVYFAFGGVRGAVCCDGDKVMHKHFILLVLAMDCWC